MVLVVGAVSVAVALAPASLARRRRTPDWATGYRFDIVLGGSEATPMED